MDTPGIILFSCGHFEEEMTSRLEKDITREFRLPVEIHQCNHDLSAFYNPVRRQYDANALLYMVEALTTEMAIKAIGLFRIDLYIPILTYIFGQATLNGKSGIASLYRLRNELYGLEQDAGLLTERFSKVVMHELGHAFGLIHCHNPVCIMRSSTYVEDVDQKKAQFCVHCRTMINSRLNF